MKHDKIHYVYAEYWKGINKIRAVQYFNNKVEAEKVLRQLQKIGIMSYIDFMWKSSILKYDTVFLHGKNIIKVENILELIAS